MHYSDYDQRSDPGNYQGPATPGLNYLARREARPLSADTWQRAVGLLTGSRLNHPLAPDSPLAHQLYVLNGGLIRESLAAPGNQVDAIFDFGTDPARQLDKLFLLILSRNPSAEERSTFLPELKNSSESRSRVRDIAFALLASREFGSIR